MRKTRTSAAPVVTALIAAGCLALSACGGAATTAASGDSGGSSDSGSSEAISTSTAKAVPADVVVSSPTASASSSSTSLSRGAKVHQEGHPPDGGSQIPQDQQQQQPPSDQQQQQQQQGGDDQQQAGDDQQEADTAATGPADFEGKREDMRELLAADGDCTFTLTFRQAEEPTCYGPTLNYANHPEATNRDSDTTDSDSNFNDMDGDGQLPSGDLGLWSATSGTAGEACAAAQMNSLVDDVTSKLDNVIKLFGAMACAAHKAGLELPATGASLSVADAMSTHAAISGITYSSATIERLSDDSSGNAVYQSTLVISMEVGGSTQSGTLILKHIPTNSDNTTYKGRLAMMMHSSSFDQAGGGNCGTSGLTGITEAGAIHYEKASETDLKMEVKHTQFCGGETEPFTADLDLDPADRVSQSNPDGWGNDWNYGLFNVNPSTGMGSVVYAWQAGANDGATRVFHVETSEAADGSASGTAYFGFGPGADETDAGAIDGFYCNWAGPNNRAQLHAGVQRQVLARAAGATVFTPASSNLSYAPTNSCDSDGTDGAGNTFRFMAESGDFDLDNDTGAAVTNELIDVSEMSFTMPTVPSEL